MPASLLIISEQNINQFITFNFYSCCYPKYPNTRDWLIYMYIGTAHKGLMKMD